MVYIFCIISVLRINVISEKIEGAKEWGYDNFLSIILRLGARILFEAKKFLNKKIGHKSKCSVTTTL